MGRGSPEIQGFVYSFRRMMAVRIKILGAKFFFGNHHAGSSLGTSDSKSFAPRSCYPTTWARNAFSPPRRRSGRSKEHTSDLQSRMHLSYSGVCLKNKNTTTNNY